MVAAVQSPSPSSTGARVAFPVPRFRLAAWGTPTNGSSQEGFDHAACLEPARGPPAHHRARSSIVLGAACASRTAPPAPLVVSSAPFPALPVQPESGPAVEGEGRPFTRGDAARGRDVYRFETFGNEGFWT